MSEGEREGGRKGGRISRPIAEQLRSLFPQNSRTAPPRIWYEEKFCVARRRPEKVRPRCGQRCRRGAAFKSPVAEFGNDADDDDAFFLSARATALSQGEREGRWTR